MVSLEPNHRIFTKTKIHNMKKHKVKPEIKEQEVLQHFTSLVKDISTLWFNYKDRTAMPVQFLLLSV